MVDKLDIFCLTVTYAYLRRKKYCQCPERSGRKGNRMNVLDNTAHPSHVQNASWSLPFLRANAENTRYSKTADQDESSRRKSFSVPFYRAGD